MTTQKTIYLDHAAATPMDAAVATAMEPYFRHEFYNPSALYLAARKVRADIETARNSVARVLGARPSEVVFTAGGTEANNLAIHGVMQQYPKGNIVVSSIEHDSVLEPACQYDCRIAPVDHNGQLQLAALKAVIDDNTVLISVMYANNETGAIQPISQVARLVTELRAERLTKGDRTPLYLHTDACQAANYLMLTKSRLGVDMMTLNGGKVYGPKQSGCLYVAANVKIEPQIRGGGQERGLRSGTESAANIIGFAKALALAQEFRASESSRLMKLRGEYVDSLAKKLPGVVITRTPKTGVLPNFVHVQVPEVDNERLIMELDERGVMAATGSACSASNDEPSHVLIAMGLSEQEAQSSIRFTMGRATTKSDIEKTISILLDLAS